MNGIMTNRWIAAISSHGKMICFDRDQVAALHFTPKIDHAIYPSLPEAVNIHLKGGGVLWTDDGDVIKHLKETETRTE